MSSNPNNSVQLGPKKKRSAPCSYVQKRDRTDQPGSLFKFPKDDKNVTRLVKIRNGILLFIAQDTGLSPAMLVKREIPTHLQNQVHKNY